MASKKVVDGLKFLFFESNNVFEVRIYEKENISVIPKFLLKRSKCAMEIVYSVFCGPLSVLPKGGLINL